MVHIQNMFRLAYLRRFVLHLLQNLPDNRGIVTVTVELRLHECYQAMPLQAISEKDWLILTLTMITPFRLV